jgi:hypothetical protein
MAQAQPRFRIRYEIPRDANLYAYFYADTFGEAREKFFNKFPGTSHIADVSIVEDEDYPDPAINLLGTNDAMVWAEEFVRIMNRMDWDILDIDEGLMVCWFANAMAAQEAVDDKKKNNGDEPCAFSIGWAWAYACVAAKEGKDFLDITAPEMWEAAKTDFGDCLYVAGRDDYMKCRNNDG